jgi:ribosome maturation factor RimP
VRKLLEPLVSVAGFDLEEIRVEPAGRRRLVRVIVDADGGVSLDDVALLSQDLSRALDETDVMGSAPYALEVGSPGVDRPLTEPRHWRRAVSRLVRVPLAEGGEITGRVLAAGETGVELDVAGERRAFAYAELGRGKVQVEFRRNDRDEPDVDAIDVDDSDVDDEDEGGASWTST